VNGENKPYNRNDSKYSKEITLEERAKARENQKRHD
jgi:hypothetical protein